jgi:hypothetical protein
LRSKSSHLGRRVATAVVVEVAVTVGGVGGGPCRLRKLGGEGGRYGKEAGLVGAVAAGAVAAAVVLAALAAAVVSTAAAVMSMAAVEDQCQPLVGLLLGLGGDDGSS